MSVRVLIMRALAVLCILGAVGLLVYEYIDTGSIDLSGNKPIKLVSIVFSGIVLFYKSFTVLDVVKQNNSIIEKEFFSLTNGIFKDEDKKAKAIFKKGFTKYSFDKNDKAVKLFNNALKYTENYKARAVITAMIGKIAFEKYNFPAAEDMLKKALSIDRSCSKAWSFYLDLSIAQKDFKKAEAIGEEAMMYCKDDVFIFSKVGTGYILSGKYEKALKVFKDAKRIEPDNPVHHSNLAIAYAGIGNEKEAMIALEDAKILNYDDPESTLEMMQSLLKKAELRKVKYTGKFELSLDGCENISDCTVEDVMDNLRELWDGEYEFVILTPPEEVKDVLFIQVTTDGDNKAIVQMSVGPNGSGVLYEKCCSFEEAEAIFINFIKDKRTPSTITFKQVEFI